MIFDKFFIFINQNNYLILQAQSKTEKNLEFWKIYQHNLFLYTLNLQFNIYTYNEIFLISPSIIWN